MLSALVLGFPDPLSMGLASGWLMAGCQIKGIWFPRRAISSSQFERDRGWARTAPGISMHGICERAGLRPRAVPPLARKPVSHKKRSYHHGNLKAALLAAGIDELEEKGLAALSLRAIAARAGVSHTAPKNHFGSLRGLLTAIAAEGFRRHAAFMRQGLSEASRRKERLRAAIKGYVRFAKEHKALFQLMFSSQHCDFADPDLQEAATSSYAVLSQIATDLDWDKAGAPDAQQRSEILLWSLAHGFAQLSDAGLLGPGKPASSKRNRAFDILDILPDFSYLPEKPKSKAR